MNHFRKRTRGRGFTLMEVVVSIGVLAVALSVIVASIGFSSSRSAENTYKILALSLAETALTDVRGAIANGLDKSEILEVAMPVSESRSEDILYFDVNGLPVEQGRGFFSCVLTFFPDAEVSGLLHVHARVFWPTRAMIGREQGSVEILTSYTIS